VPVGAKGNATDSEKRPPQKRGFLQFWTDGKCLQCMLPTEEHCSRGLSLVYSCRSRFNFGIASQMIILFCASSLATRSAFRSFASLQSA
jgi:hypothetical protein